MTAQDTVWVWGQMGDGSVTYTTPTQVPGLGTGSTPVSLGAVTQIDADAEWYTFVAGGNPYGLGNNKSCGLSQSTTTLIYTSPVSIATTSTTLPGTAFAWSGLSGGAGAFTGPLLQTDGGGNWCAGLDTAGNVFAWGGTNNGIMGNNNTGAMVVTSGGSSGQPAPSPVWAVGGSATALLACDPIHGGISGGSSHCVAIEASGVAATQTGITSLAGKTTVCAWGEDDYGQGGDAIPLGTSGVALSQFSANVSFTNGSPTCDTSSVLASWSGMPIQRAGIPVNTYIFSVNVGLGSFMLSSSPTSQVNVNYSGTTGSKSATIGAVNPVPIRVVTGAQSDASGFLAKAKYVSVGNKHSMALTDVGASAVNNVFTWGQNQFGQLGNGLSGLVNNSSVPVAVDWAAAVGGTPHLPILIIFAGGGVDGQDGQNLAIDTTGQLWAWGNNTWGQCGLGTTGTPNFSTAVVVPHLVNISLAGGLTIVAAASGTRHAMALRSDNAFFIWGDNTQGCCGSTQAPFNAVLQPPGPPGNIATSVPTIINRNLLGGPTATLPTGATINAIMAGNGTSTVQLTQTLAPVPVNATRLQSRGMFMG